MSEDVNTDTGEITPRKRKPSNTWLKLKQFADRWQEQNDGEVFLILPMHHAHIKPIADIDDDEYTERLNAFFSMPFFSSNKIAQTPIALVRNWNALGKKREPPADIELEYICKCGKHHKMRRSQWKRWANKTVKCNDCQLPFNVNEVIDQITLASQIISEMKK